MAKDSRQTIDGLVLKDTVNKTGVLLVTRLKMHQKYKRKYKVTKKYLFHDAENICRAGDEASIIETKRYSKRKSWRLAERYQKSASKG